MPEGSCELAAASAYPLSTLQVSGESVAGRQML